MNINNFNYELPKHLIAQEPLEKRDHSRLLVVDRKNGTLSDKQFRDIAAYFEAGDCLVLNDTKVFPARLAALKKNTGGKVDLLLLEQAPEKPVNIWRCLVQPTLKEGQEISFASSEATARFIGRDPDGICLFEFSHANVYQMAQAIGHMPLPPYIKRDSGEKDFSVYQTVYAKEIGAVAAPTAGLHFTEELLNEIKAKGVQICFVTLHVGYGTFKSVEDPENHQMHAERFELKPETAEVLNQAKAGGRKIWAVGTTAMRVLETCVQSGKLVAGKGETDLFVTPGFEFEAVDYLITNFHLPKTTLLLLVAAFMGEALQARAYKHAIAAGYRFYSYGDAMVII